MKKRLENLRDPFYVGEEFYDWPVYGGEGILGVVRIPGERAEAFEETQKIFLHSMLECVALAMDRILAVRKQVRSRQQIQQERYRGNLLRAISHDLRTPLSGIMGTSEMIMDMSKKRIPDLIWRKGSIRMPSGSTPSWKHSEPDQASGGQDGH